MTEPLGRLQIRAKLWLRTLQREHFERYVKPHNVMMASDGLAKVTDFGLAKAAAQALQSYLQVGAEDEDIPAMPAKLVSLLSRCFQQTPDERPPASCLAISRRSPARMLSGF